MTMTRTQAEAKLQSLFGISHFYDEQWTAIDQLLQGKRVLMVERTGFGKSLCYQFPATQFPGVTVVFSPLIALMKDQVDSLVRRGIGAAFINSTQEPDEQDEVFRHLRHGDIKVLYIAPERQENARWQEAVAPGNGIKISMVVIDEAHCVSAWGHDFRPDYRKICDLVRQLASSTPVLAVTATATTRVQNDIKAQMGGNVTVIRGALCRENLHLRVVQVETEEQKMMWLAQNISKLPGFGIIYCGTTTDTEIYAAWLQKLGVNALHYHGRMENDVRSEIQEKMMRNEYKCVVATNSLGMGIDKSDICFIIHTQVPQSPIHYYQEIGRAGRDGKDAYAVLLFNRSLNKKGVYADQELPEAFIDGGRPAVKKYEEVIDYVKTHREGEQSIQKALNMKQTPIRTILADLQEQGIIRKVADGRKNVYERVYGAKSLDTTKFDELRNARREDLKVMLDYVFTCEPRMQFLCQFLEDEHAVPAAACDNTTDEPWPVSLPDAPLAEKVDNFMEHFHPVLVVETKSSNIRNGVAASYYGASNVGKLIHKSKYEDGGDFDGKLLDLTVDAFNSELKSRMAYDKIIYVPPTSHGDLVRNFAVKLGSRLGIPVCHSLMKTGETKEQKIFNNGFLKRANVKDMFNISESLVRGKNILLIDDVFDSGATVKEIGSMLTKKGAANIVPLVIARTVGSDN